MRARLLGPTALLFLGVSCEYSHGQTAIEGRVKLPDPRPAAVKIQRYEIVSKGGVVAMDPPLAVVYLEGGFPTPASLPKVQMVQRNLSFVTPLLPVRVGTTVEFPNQDSTYHNIFSYSKAKRFDLGRYLPDERPIPSQVFDKPGLVQLHCDIHQHMRAIVLVLETPHFVVTDEQGRFRLAGLPAGSFKLKAWMNSRKTIEVPVELKNGATLEVYFP